MSEQLTDGEPLVTEFDEGSVPLLLVPYAVWERMMGYVHACPLEIGGYGLVDRAPDNLFHLREVFILDQVVTGASVDISLATLAGNDAALRQAGDSPTRRRFFWHSHVNFSAYFSGTDLANNENALSDWMLHLVINKAGDFDARLDVFVPHRRIYELQVVVEHQVSDEMLARCSREIEQHVRQPGFIRSRRPVRPSSYPDARWVNTGERERVRSDAPET